MKKINLITVILMLALSACAATSVSKTNDAESLSIDKVFFAQYPKGWFKEFELKLPTAGIDLRRVPDIHFKTLVMLPGGGNPACRCSSPEEFKEKTRHYMLPIHIGADEDPSKTSSHHHAALNLPVRDGRIERVELLHTPDVLEKRITAKIRVLYTWKEV